MRLSYSLSVLGIASLFVGCSTTTSVLDKSLAYRKEANFFLAYTTLEEARKANPGDEAIEKAYWRARVDYLVDRGQELVFNEHMLEAIADLEAALALDASHSGAKFWIARAKAKLAANAARKADEAKTTGDLDGAFKLYTEAVTYVPGYPDGEEGLAKVRKLFELKQKKALDHYTLGVRAQADQNFEQTQYHLGEAIANDPTLDSAKSRREAVAQRLVERRIVEAKRMEAASHYGAALMEYESIAEQLPAVPGIQERIEQMKKEVEAEQRIREGEKAIFHGDWTRARLALEQAYEVSVGERKFISEMLVLLKEREQDAQYLVAKDLELEHRYAASIAAFAEIEKAWPGFKDVRARISSLEAAIEIATKAKQRGEAAEQSGDVKAAIEAYQEAVLACPGYEGLDRRIRELKTKT